MSSAEISETSKMFHLVIFFLNIACAYNICITLNVTDVCWCGLRLNL